MSMVNRGRRMKRIVFLMMTLLLTGAIFLAFNVKPAGADAATVYINSDGSVVPSSAPISSSDNITYTVTGNISYPTYNGIVVWRNNIVIDGNGYTVQGNQSGNGISLTGISNATIKNVNIQQFQYGIFLLGSNNNTVSGNNASANIYKGIYLYNSSGYNTVSGNNVSANSEYGISLDVFSNSNTVSGNTVTANNASGISLYSSNSNAVSGNIATANSYGILLDSSSNNTVSGNNASANIYKGIYLYNSSGYNTVSGNNVSANSEYGISLDVFSNSNTVSGNTVTANSEYGISLLYSSNNIMYHNNFNNTHQEYSGNSTNTWDNGYPSGGNYWSDYNGTDLYGGSYQNQTGYDGIGDAPYIIGNNNTDNFPLIQPLSGEGIVEVQTPTGNNVTVSPMVNVGVTFANVSTEGSTTWNVVEPPTEQFVSVTCNEIRTSASYTGNVTLEFGYDPSGLSLQDQQAMKIWLWNDSSSCWVDVTTYVNTTSHTVYGVSPHLSMFGVTSNLGITGDLNVTGTTTVSIPSAPPAPPSYWMALNYYQINTTKTLPAPINLRLAYNYQSIQPGQELSVRIMMWNETSLRWDDITSGVDMTSHVVYGLAPHLSMFGVTCLQSSSTAGGGGGSRMPYMN
jgi:parallel beta-helix repeat protein